MGLEDSRQIYGEDSKIDWLDKRCWDKDFKDCYTLLNVYQI